MNITATDTLPKAEGILVIGNGFDLAHGLPTDYMSFLEFTKILHILIAYPDDSVGYSNEINHSNLCQKQTIIRTFLVQAKVNSEDERVREFLDLIRGNFWVELFLPLKRHGRKWIDFEGIISEVIQHMEPYTSQNVYATKIGRTFKKVNEICGLPMPENKDQRIDRLLQDLNRLTRCLEIYLCLCQNIPVAQEQKLKYVLDIPSITHVLSFNYTDTFSRVYQSEFPIEPINYCYIHGKADMSHNENNNNMVLGIDEYLGKKRRNSQLEYVAFKKYYQRIYKHTDYFYSDWFKGSLPKKLYIIGHSLDITDKDVLKDLILHPNVQTTIFYHNKESNGKQIVNLVKLIGYDNLNLLARGRDDTRKIIFREQC